jgi:alpha-1,3-fucosyltransferase
MNIFQTLFSQLDRHRVFYLLWILFLLNIFTFKQLTLTEDDIDNKDLVIIKRIDRSAFRQLDMKKILMWNPWYGDFGFALDDDFAFRYKYNLKILITFYHTSSKFNI